MISEVEKLNDKLISSADAAGNAAIAVVIVYGFVIWPFVRIRKQFSHEINLYLTRIQGLASKAELANLAVLESKVKNETSLKEFIEATREIANRHDVSELVKTFYLWD